MGPAGVRTPAVTAWTHFHISWEITEASSASNVPCHANHQPYPENGLNLPEAQQLKGSMSGTPGGLLDLAGTLPIGFTTSPNVLL